MIDDKKVLGLIPARGGSKGVPGKNLLNLGGKPLIVWTIEAARKSKLIDRLVLSSDAPEIIAVATENGCDAPFVRPAALAEDHSSSADVILHALDQLTEPYDYIVLLQPTSPFRITEDIEDCLKLCHKRGAPAAVSLTVADKPPAWMYHLGSNGAMTPMLPIPSDATRRQDLDETYVLNGAVFVARTDYYRESKSFLGFHTVGTVMSAEQSVDIDSPLDVLIARAMNDAMSSGQSC